jgi:hypothetical protein
MIIVDEDAHDRKTAQERQQAVQAPSESGPGPSLSAADVETGHIPNAEAPPPYEASPLLQRHQDIKIRTRRRFLRACSVGIFVYVLFGLVIGLITRDDDEAEVYCAFSLCF